MPLFFRRTGAEVDSRVRTLRSLYKRYEETYGTKIFNTNAFDDRYRAALENRTDLKTFVGAEMEVFDILKKKVEPDETTAAPEHTPYSVIADRIVEENVQRVRKYRLIDFHPDAEEETKHLLGVVTDFYNESWPGMERLVRSLGSKAALAFLEKLEADFIFFAVPVRTVYSKAA